MRSLRLVKFRVILVTFSLKLVPMLTFVVRLWLLLSRVLKLIRVPFARSVTRRLLLVVKNAMKYRALVTRVRRLVMLLMRF